MGKNEKTHAKMATLAAKILNGSKKTTKKDILALAADVLTQTPDKKTKKKSK